MLYEYALDPNALWSWERLQWLEYFGVENGRMIARFPPNPVKWKRMVLKACMKYAHAHPETPGLFLTKVSEALKNPNVFNIDKKFVPLSDRPYDASTGWLENAMQSHDKEPFRAIITDSNPGDREEILTSYDMTQRSRRWKVRRSHLVPSNAEALARRLSPFLRVSQEILFIDPHFKPEVWEYSQTLEHFLSEVHPKVKRIEYHVREDAHKPSNQQFETLCREWLPQMIPPELELRIVRWKERNGRDEFHDRYILTDIGGIDFGVGLDERGDGRTTKLTLMDPEVHLALWKRFDYPLDAVNPDAEYEWVQTVRLMRPLTR